MAVLSPGDIASPIRWILRHQRNVQVLLGEVDGIDPDGKAVHLVDGATFAYDYLIVAAGATHAYFGHDDWQPYAPGLKTLEDALEMRRRVLLAFERAERESDPARREALLTFVIVGGGPTGVELAGALAEIARQSLAKDFRHFDPSSSKIILLEGGPAVLPPFPEPLRAAARRDLERLGVDVRTGTLVTRIGPGFVEAGDSRIVFVIGDLASLAGPGGRPLPGVAQVAMQMGAHASSNIARAIEAQPMRPFKYRNLGDMATIGRASAVADLPGIKLKGWIGWLAWLFVHIFNLIGFRNRLIVMVQWAWSYFSYQRAIRLITGK
jgi:NADH dehydrogenase